MKQIAPQFSTRTAPAQPRPGKSWLENAGLENAWLARALLVLLCAGAPAAATLIAPASANAEVIDRIVARVNDDVVTFYEVKKAAIPYMLQQGVNPVVLKDPQKRGEIYKRVLKDQVERFLLGQEADTLGIEVSDAEVDQWLARTRKQQNLSEAQFREMVSGYGMDFKTYRAMIHDNLIKMRIVKVKIGSQISISEGDVERAYLERYGDDGAKTKFIEVGNILIKPADSSPEAVEKAQKKAQAARQAIRDGADFSQAAEMFSEGPAASNGGYMGRFAEGELEPSFGDIAFSMEAGTISEVVKTAFGFQIIQVRKVEYEAAANIDKRKQELRAELQQKAVDRQLQAYLQKLRSQSFVETSL